MMDSQFATLNQLILASIKKYGEDACFYYKRDGHFESISYRRLLDVALRLVRFSGIRHCPRRTDCDICGQ